MAKKVDNKNQSKAFEHQTENTQPSFLSCDLNSEYTFQSNHSKDDDKSENLKDMKSDIAGNADKLKSELSENTFDLYRDSESLNKDDNNDGTMVNKVENKIQEQKPKSFTNQKKPKWKVKVQENKISKIKTPKNKVRKTKPNYSTVKPISPNTIKNRRKVSPIGQQSPSKIICNPIGETKGSKIYCNPDIPGWRKDPSKKFITF